MLYLKSFAFLPMFLAIATFASNATAASNDDLQYTGDRLIYAYDMIAWTVKSDGTRVVKVCIPAGTELRGIDGKSDANKLWVVIEGGRYKRSFEADTKCSLDQGVEGYTGNAPMNVILEIEKNPTGSNPYSRAEPSERYGLTYGALVIPFKYYYSSTKDMTGGGTLGAYMGNRYSVLGLGVKAIVFIGATSIPVDQNVNGQPTSQNLTGFSYGVGFVGDIKKDFQFGVVFGTDRVSEASQYSRNAQPWLAVSLGFNFAK